MNASQLIHGVLNVVRDHIQPLPAPQYTAIHVGVTHGGNSRLELPMVVTQGSDGRPDPLLAEL